MNHHIQRFTALISRPVIFLAIIASIFALTAATDASTAFAPRVTDSSSTPSSLSTKKTPVQRAPSTSSTQPASDVTQPALIYTTSPPVTAPNGSTFQSTGGPVPTGSITNPKPTPLPPPTPVPPVFVPGYPNPEPIDPPYTGCHTCGTMPANTDSLRKPSMMCPMNCLL